MIAEEVLMVSAFRLLRYDNIIERGREAGTGERDENKDEKRCGVFFFSRRLNESIVYHSTGVTSS